MFVVALTELAGQLESEAGALATQLGLTVFEVRLRLSGVLPRIVFQSPVEADASRILAFLRARGHTVFLCDTREVPAGSRLIRLHRFALEDATLLANAGGDDRLAYDEISLILLVAARTDVVRDTGRVELSVRTKPGGGTVQERESSRHEHVIENAAYLFPRLAWGEPLPRPWLLHEREAQYVSLGPAMKPTRHENFLATIALLRARAPQALYDDRYSTKPLDSAHFVLVRGHDAAEPALTDGGNDLAVHLLATLLLTKGAGAYR